MSDKNFASFGRIIKNLDTTEITGTNYEKILVGRKTDEISFRY